MRALGRALFALLVLAAPLGAHEVPGTVQHERALYPYTHPGFEKFVADTLPDLVEGDTFDSHGRRVEVVKLHAVRRHQLTRWVPARDGMDVPHRAWVIAIVHARVDGRLTRGRVEATARYVGLPDGWEWERAQLYLGTNWAYDFVTGEVR